MADRRALVWNSTTQKRQEQVNTDALIVGTGPTTASGNLVLNAAGASIDVTSGKHFTALGGASNFAWGGSSGTFATPTGAATHNGVSTFGAAGVALIVTNSARVSGEFEADGGIGRSSAGALIIGADAQSSSVELGKSGALTTVKGNLQVDGTETVVGATTFQGNTVFGDAITDTVDFVARLVSDFLPLADNLRSVGSSALRMLGVHATSLVARADATDTIKATLAGASLTAAGGAFLVTAGANALSLNGASLNLQTASATRIAITDTTAVVQAGVTLSTTGTGMINLPSLFQIAGSAVGATVTAANLTTLTNGSNADALHTHSAINSVTLSGTAGEAVSAGAPVSCENVTGTAKFFRADADGTDLRRNAVGLATNSPAGDGSAITVQTEGEISVDDARWVVAPVVADVGKQFFLSTTVGLLTLTAPASAADVVPMGTVTRGGAGAVKVDLHLGDATTLA